MCVSLCPLWKQFWLLGLLFPNTWAYSLRNWESSVSIVRPITKMRWSFRTAMRGHWILSRWRGHCVHSCDPMTQAFFRISSWAITILHSVRVQEFLSFAIQTMDAIASYEHVHKGQISAVYSTLRTPSHWPDLRYMTHFKGAGTVVAQCQELVQSPKEGLGIQVPMTHCPLWWGAASPKYWRREGTKQTLANEQLEMNDSDP